MENFNQWLDDAYFDEATKAELKAIENDEKEIKERFIKDLDFGTAGLRGIIGAGTNRINIYTVRRATQGFANYILREAPEGKEMGVAIAYDSRNMSPEFAEETALVLNGNGIRSYVFDSLRPTPMLSFAVRHLGCIAGVVITASHNPPEYNGYKAYWSDGAQIPYPRDEAIIKEVNGITDFTTIRRLEKSDAEKSGLFNVLGKDIDDEYIKNVKAQCINPEMIKEVADSLKIVFTPLHGAGNIPVRRVLDEVGFKNVYVVKEQEEPDANFSTVGYPNPEDPKAFALGMKLADELGADLVVGTDPDADRVGAVVKNAKGEYVILSGNMSGTLIEEYIVSQKKEKGTLPKNGAIVSTIVSSPLAAAIAKENGLTYFNVLTGFKYIGEKIKEFEQTGSHEYVFGFEESYGCLAGTYARDKDAVVATMLICELAAFYKAKGMSLYEGLQEVYKKYGYYKEKIESLNFKGIEGLAKMKEIMESIRSNPPAEVAGMKIAEVRDYKSGMTTVLSTGEKVKIDLPSSDVLYYALEDGSWFCVRPSGTEPKIKVYFGVKAESESGADEKVAALIKGAMTLFE